MFYFSWYVMMYHVVVVSSLVQLMTFIPCQPPSLSVAFILLTHRCGWNAVKGTLQKCKVYLDAAFSFNCKCCFPFISCFFNLMLFEVLRIWGSASLWWVVALFWFLWELTTNKSAARVSQCWSGCHITASAIKIFFRIISIHGHSADQID